MKSKKKSGYILILLTVIVIFLLMKDNYQEITNAIIHVKISWIFITIILYLLYLLLQTIPFFDFVKLYKKDITFSYMFYIMVVTNFFNGITPLATGGQPLQVYELHKKNISVVDATNAVIQNSIIYQIAVVIWMLLAITINHIFHFFVITKALRNLMIIGIILNVLLLLLFIIVSFSKKFNQKLINVFINILSKVHIIKKPQEKKKKWQKTCTEFYNNSKILLDNKKILLKGVIIILIAFSFYYSIPLTISYALNCSENMTIITTMVLSSFVLLSSNYLPIPGATGGMEYTFVGYFKNFVTGFKLNALLLIWRFITYYLPTIVGGIIFNVYSLNNTEKNS